jgi:hypothetical protein
MLAPRTNIINYVISVLTKPAILGGNLPILANHARCRNAGKTIGFSRSLHISEVSEVEW